MDWLLRPDVLGDIGYAVVLFVLLTLTRPVYLAFTKRKKGYGVVFDSVTGLPLQLATVRLVIPGVYGTPVATAVTDKHGRYSLQGRPGEFIVEVTKTGYTFPSTYLKKRTSLYDNLLPSSRIIVKDFGLMTKNIPMDPAKGGRSKIFHWRLVLGKETQLLIAYLSPLLLAIYPYFLHKTVIAWVVYVIYIAVMLQRVFTFKPGHPAFGTIRDAQSNEPIPQTVVRIFNAKFNKLMDTQITAARGRYAFLVHSGTYYILISRDGYKSLRLNYPVIKKDGTVLAKDVKLKRAAIKKSDQASAQPLKPLTGQGAGTGMGTGF
jgi:hypothetical protein